MAAFIPLIAAAVTTAGTVYAAQQSRKAAKSAQPAAPGTPEAIPEVSAPEPMPVSDGAATALAKRRSVSDQLRRRGRASTILTDLQGGEGLGG